eukprot:14290655-Alexandrium_andersonii.AAC.1
MAPGQDRTIERGAREDRRWRHRVARLRGDRARLRPGLRLAPRARGGQRRRQAVCRGVPDGRRRGEDF